RRRHTRSLRDWSSDVCSSDLWIEIVAQMSYIVGLTKEVPMAATAFVRARIDETLKDEAAAVLAELGLTVSDVVRMTLTRVAKDRSEERRVGKECRSRRWRDQG